MKSLNQSAIINLKRHTYALLAASAISLIPATSTAELLGQANGRLPTSVMGSPLSIELGYTQGSLAGTDYDYKGVRINYQYKKDMVLFADLGATSVGSNAENSMGIGAFYNLGKAVSFSDSIALKASVHTIKLQSLGTSSSYSSGVECTNGGTAIDPYTLELVLVPGSCTANPTYTPGSSGSGSKLTTFSVELLMAGGYVEQLRSANNKVPSWYANTGVHSFSGAGNNAELSIGGGLVLPVSVGEAYIALDYISDFVIGLGFRYNVR